MSDTQFISGPHGNLAYKFLKGTSPLPPLLFIHGFKSDMDGSKAEWLHDYCVANDRTYLRFDCSAHGKSNGNFMDFTIGQAINDAKFMIETFLDHPAIIIGSSMGGWVGLRLIELCPHSLAGFIGIAAAPDFTRDILTKATPAQHTELKQNGFISEDSGYEEPYIFTQKLFNDGEAQCILDRKISTPCPLYLLQGKKDSSVEWQKTDAIKNVFGDAVNITLIDDGDHSLSRDKDLLILKSSIEKMNA